MDRVSKATRSQVMGSIRNAGTRLEMRLADALRKSRLSDFDRNLSSLPGKPDFVYRRKKVAVFVDSCFWHGCRWHCRMPSSNRRYWIAKIERNRKRDKEVTASLRRQGWFVVRIWEHSLNEQGKINTVISKLKQALKQADKGKKRAAQ